MNLEQLKETEYVKCMDLLAKLIDLDLDEKEIIHKDLQSMGIRNFFLHLDSAKLPPEAIGKLKNIKAIIDLSYVKRGQI